MSAINLLEFSFTCFFFPFHFERYSGYGKDPKRSKFEFYGRIPRLTIQGHYKLNGKVILLPVQGDGPANMTFGKV